MCILNLLKNNYKVLIKNLNPAEHKYVCIQITFALTTSLLNQNTDRMDVCGMQFITLCNIKNIIDLNENKTEKIHFNLSKAQ